MDLGVMVNIHEDTEFTGAFEEARAAGFTHGQVNSYLPRLTADEVRLLALAARNEGFTIDAVGCYINPMRLKDPSLHNVTVDDWKTLAENMSMMNGCQRIVCWSGTLGKTLAIPNLLNQEEESFNNLFISLSGMLEQVRGIPVQMLLEPYSAHMLYDAASCLRMTQKFPSGDVKIVMDAPNVVHPKEFPVRDDIVKSFVREISKVAGIIHLKDIQMDEDGHRVFPYAGAGVLDYQTYIRAISEYMPDVPVIIDQVKGYAEMVAAKEFVENTIKICEL